MCFDTFDAELLYVVYFSLHLFFLKSLLDLTDDQHACFDAELLYVVYFSLHLYVLNSILD